MHNPGFDPGLTQQFTAPVRRIINQDGTFNVRRSGTNWRDFHPYLALINMSWAGFLVSLLLGYTAANTLFACAYFALGPGHLAGGDAPTAAGRFLNCFFFSAHTLTTVGYGNLAPASVTANLVAAFEALVGVLGFAVATGLLFGRVSRPSARIGFSPNMIVAQYQEGMSLQFRVVNRRRNSLAELQVKCLLMTVDPVDGGARRTYTLLRMERPEVLFLALTWTIVHPIDRDSPLWGKTAADLERMQAEVLIMIKAYDDSFSQNVVARYSYRHDEIVWDSHFVPAFYVDEKGDLVLEVQKVGALV
jgi:inward rectifier potassium channel